MSTSELRPGVHHDHGKFLSLVDGSSLKELSDAVASGSKGNHDVAVSNFLCGPRGDDFGGQFDAFSDEGVDLVAHNFFRIVFGRIGRQSGDNGANVLDGGAHTHGMRTTLDEK